MRAVVVESFGPYEAAAVRELEVPEPGPREVRIAVAAAGVNFADLLVIQGRYQIRPPLPFVPGRECAGTVEAVGEEVGDVAPGDRVLAYVVHGTFAEKVCAPAATCFPLPGEMGFGLGVALGLGYQTAHFALLDRADFVGGERVLITGASGNVGLAAVQLAKAKGGVVLAGVRSDAQAAFVRGHEADQVVRLDAEDLHETLPAQVREATNEHGADIVVDTVGGRVFQAAFRSLAWRGRMVAVGFASGDMPTIEANDLRRRNVSVAGLRWSDYRQREPKWIGRVQKEIFALHGKGSLAPTVAGRYPLEEFARAMAAVEAPGKQGKIVLDPRREEAEPAPHVGEG